MPGDTVGALRADGRISAAIPVGSSPADVAVDGDALWVANADDASVSLIDAGSGVVKQVVALEPGSVPVALTVLGDDVWVVDSRNGRLVQVSTVTARVVGSIPVGHNPSAIAAGLGWLWVTNEADATLSRIDPNLQKPPGVVDVGDAPDGVSVGVGAVWVSNRGDDTVSVVNPGSLTPRTDPIPVGAGPVGISATPGAVWVADSLDLTVARINTATFAVTKTPTADSPTDVAVFAGAVWVSEAGAGTVVRLNTDMGQVTRRYAIGSSPHQLAASKSALWVTTVPYPAKAHTGGTLTIALAPDQLVNGAAALSDIDPAAVYLGPVLSVVSSVYDGLVGVHRADGAAAYELVPDLARSLPTATDGGKTYSFTLRTGLRYSDGQHVRATDFRRGLEREIVLRTTDYYDNIVGTAACETHPKQPCDLRRGIGADNTAGTVTFHLLHPDADFLARLATYALASPAPPGTPMHDVGRRAIPGTGPYKISSFVPGHSLTLVRNKYYSVWSSAAKPAGYVDVIRWVVMKSYAAALSAVEHGRASLTFPDPADLARLQRTHAGRVLTSPSVGIHFLVLNSTIAPFNNATARQAVAYALSSDAMVAKLLGGQPACAIVPPGWPGQSAGCPYPANLTTARDLVRRSTTWGQSVHVYFPSADPHAAIGEHVTRVLTRIGYRATLTLQDWGDYDPSRYDPRSRPVNIEEEGWMADFPAISQYYEVVSCAHGELNALGVCNRRIDAAATRAAGTATDPGAAQRSWQAVYNEVAKDAKVVPDSTETVTSVLVAAGVGNIHFSPFAGLLFDQLWVR
jgi:peptide/nickel transport system substrate-binding protein